jgi:hypothetical protein
MHEAVLRDFFLGAADAALLRADLQGGVVRAGITRRHRIVDMDTELGVDPAHLVRLCDAVLEGALPPSALQQLGFCLLASDHFDWDADTPGGAVVAETVADWSCPEVNWPLTVATVRQHRAGLVAGRYLFVRSQGPHEALQPAGVARLVAHDVKVSPGGPGC